MAMQLASIIALSCVSLSSGAATDGAQNLRGASSVDGDAVDDAGRRLNSMSCRQECAGMTGVHNHEKCMLACDQREAAVAGANFCKEWYDGYEDFCEGRHMGPCTFHVKTEGHSCLHWCHQKGRKCVGSNNHFDHPSDACSAASLQSLTSCEDQHQHQLCICE